MAIRTEVLCMIERGFLTLILALKCCLFSYLSQLYQCAQQKLHMPIMNSINFTGRRLKWWKTSPAFSYNAHLVYAKSTTNLKSCFLKKLPYLSLLSVLSYVHI